MDREETYRILSDMVSHLRPSSELLAEFSRVSPDPLKALFVFEAEMLVGVLNAYLDGHLDAKELQSWAARLHGRGDIGYESETSDVVSEMMMWLAMPMAFYPINHETVSLILENIKHNRIREPKDQVQ